MLLGICVDEWDKGTLGGPRSVFGGNEEFDPWRTVANSYVWPEQLLG